MAVGAVSRAAASLSLVMPQDEATESSLPVSRRLPALDGLRGIAILLVLLWHGIFQVKPQSTAAARLVSLGSLSWSGVDLFFVLSGFLIGGILLDERESPRYFQTFYIRRAYRILPLYAALLSAQILTRLPFLPHWIAPFSPDPVPLWSYVSFTQNIWMAGIAGFGSVVMTATWSLAIEEQFYLTSPVVVRRFQQRQLAKILVAVILADPLLRAWLCFRFPHGGFASYVLMPCRADDLCLGMLVAMAVREQKVWRWVISHRRTLHGSAMMLAVPLAYFTWRHYGPYNGVMASFGYTALGLFYTCCLLIALTSAGPVRRVLCSRKLMQLGTVAYCTYLFHLPIIEFCDRVLRRRFSGVGSTIDVAAGMLGIVLTLILATLSWKYFEGPLLHRGHAYKY